ncbi:MAG: high frequency lysogenization protein HflD [Gammaproteobacteria bacterium]|nr:high frequency lysogenization protein HflD [Gammaproteobacteria bacterium]
MSSIDDQVLALAGIFQAAYLVAKIAKTGIHPQDCFASSINSLFVFDADSTSGIYQGSANLTVGLRVCSQVLERKGLSDISREYFDIFRYGLNLLQLERKLSKYPAMMDHIGERLKDITMRTDHFSPTHSQVIADIALLYHETVSTLARRIQVRGETRFLQNEVNVNKVRALLLSGIRSSVLWHQLGGRRWHLLFFRNRLRSAISHQMNLIQAD